MTRLVRRLAVIIGGSCALLAAVTAPANAGIAMNHCESVAHVHTTRGDAVGGR